MTPFDYSKIAAEILKTIDEKGVDFAGKEFHAALLAEIDQVTEKEVKERGKVPPLFKQKVFRATDRLRLKELKND